MRVILYTGKGGVSKTSVAAATACRIAEEGKTVLIASTDQAHSLGDSFDMKLAAEPVHVAERLYAMEIDAVEENEKAWGNLRDYLKRLLTAKSEDGLEAEELLVFPGFEELFSLLKIKEIYEENRYDVLIVDCAPTGETMSLLKFPEMLGWWMEHLFGIKRAAVKVAGPLVEKTTGIPMPGEETFNEVENLYGRLGELRRLLCRKEEVSVRIVTTPERIVVKEAKRNFSYLHLYDYNVDAVIVNKIYPQASLDGYFNRWMECQRESLKDIHGSFGEIPVFHLEYMKSELRTLNKLKDAAKQLYANTDPSAILFQDTVFALRREEDRYCLYVTLPFASRQEFELEQRGDELHISVKNQHRNLMLPKKLQNREIESAKSEEGCLKILFSEMAPD